MGKEITVKLDPFKMSFRNELIGKTPHLPKGLYWGVHSFLFDQNWKIDIWAIDSKELKEKQSVIEKIKHKVNHDNRLTILKLKNQLHNHPLYRKTFFSVDIYDAVLEDKITSSEQFKEWIYSTKDIEI